MRFHLAFAAFFVGWTCGLAAADAQVRRAVAAAPPPAAQSEDVDEVARYVAGMRPLKPGPLAKLTELEAWQTYAYHWDARWRFFDVNRTQRIRSWCATELAKVPSS